MKLQNDRNKYINIASYNLAESIYTQNKEIHLLFEMYLFNGTFISNNRFIYFLRLLFPDATYISEHHIYFCAVFSSNPAYYLNILHTNTVFKLFKTLWSMSMFCRALIRSSTSQNLQGCQNDILWQPMLINFVLLWPACHL